MQLFAAVFLAIFLGLLWLPPFLVLMDQTRLSIREMVRRGWLVCLIQPPAAIVLSYLAIRADLGNPAVLFLSKWYRRR